MCIQLGADYRGLTHNRISQYIGYPLDKPTQQPCRDLIHSYSVSNKIYSYKQYGVPMKNQQTKLEKNKRTNITQYSSESELRCGISLLDWDEFDGPASTQQR